MTRHATRKTVFAIMTSLAVALAATAQGNSTRAVPGTVIAQMKHAISGPVYVPTVLPRGYRYRRWRKEASRPKRGQDWYTVTFKHGGKLLDWTVAGHDTGCSAYSTGHIGSYYWGFATSDGRDAWTCLRARVGRVALDIDLFDHRRPLLAVDDLVTTLRSARNAG